MIEKDRQFHPLDKDIPSLLALQKQAIADDYANLTAVTNEMLTTFSREVTPLGVAPEQQRPDGTVDWEAELQVALDDQHKLTLRPASLVDAENLRRTNERLLRAKQALENGREE